MNIFVLDHCPRQAATYLCDKHVPKMAVETLQMMASALRRHGVGDDEMPLTQAGSPVKGGYRHHPCTVWAGETQFNFFWLGLHGLAICDQFKARFGKVHACHDGIRQMHSLSSRVPVHPRGMTNFVQAMPDQYRVENDAVGAYRAYYWHEKAAFARWNKGIPAPEWWGTPACV